MSGEPRRPLRVLYVVSLFPCWSETFIVREIQALLRLGVEVRILSLRHPSETLVQSAAATLGSRVLYPPSVWRALPALLSRVLLQPRASLGTLIEIVSSLRRRPISLAKSLVVWWRTLAVSGRVEELRPDLIHAHWATYPSTSALLLSRLLGVPFSFTSHAHDIFLEDQLVGAKLAESAFAVTISEFNRRFLEARHGTAAVRRLRVLRCGLSPAEVAFEPEGREPETVLAVGRLDPIKGFDVLIEALGVLRDRGRPVRCEIVGEGEQRGRLEARIAALGLTDRVQLPGAMPQEKLRERLRRAMVFALPSVVAADGNQDGVPVALMEAMAAGLPVVSTGVSGIPELVEDGVTGLLATAGDPVSLADRIGRLLADAPLRARLAEQARRVVEQRFDVDREASRLAAWFAEAARKTRVLIVTDEMEVGGTQRQIAHLARHIDRDRFDLTVAYFRNRSFLVDQLEQAGARVVHVPKRAAIDPLFLLRLRNLLAAGRFDVVHCFSFTAELWSMLARRLSRPTPLICSVRNSREDYTGLHRLLRRWAARSACLVVANSEAGARFATAEMGVAPEAVRVVYNGVETAGANGHALARAELGLPASAVAGLFVGRLVPQKNVPLLIQAASRLGADGRFVLLLAGDGPDRAALETQVRELGLGHSVRFLGQRDDATALMGACDFVVLPSLHEGLSNVLLEAMAAGRPVVASDAGGNRELVSGGETGLVFPSGDAAALAECLRTLIEDAGTRQRLGAAGRQRAADRFSMQGMVGALEHVYAESAGRRA